MKCRLIKEDKLYKYNIVVLILLLIVHLSFSLDVKNTNNVYKSNRNSSFLANDDIDDTDFEDINMLSEMKSTTKDFSSNYDRNIKNKNKNVKLVSNIRKMQQQKKEQNEMEDKIHDKLPIEKKNENDKAILFIQANEKKTANELDHDINVSIPSNKVDPDQLKFVGESIPAKRDSMKSTNESNEIFRSLNSDLNKNKQIDNKINSIESNKLYSQLDPKFVENLLKIQNNPDMKNLINSPSSNENKSFSTEPNSLIIKTKEKVNKNLLKNYYKPEEIDMTKLSYLNEIIGKVRNDVRKKTLENDQLAVTNSQLEKNYEQLNSQVLIYQTKLDSIMGEINLFSNIKNSYNNQIDKIREGNNLITEMNDLFEKINNDINSKSDFIQKYEEKIQIDLKNFNNEKTKLKDTYDQKTKTLNEIKKSYSSAENSKLKLIENIKNSFENFSKEEIKLLKMRNEETDLEMKVKNEENEEKLIAIENEHLKAINLVEIQKIEELKKDIENSKNMRDYLKQEIHEFEEKLKNAESENKQNQIEYELKKNELEDKLNNLKVEMKNEESLNKEEKIKYKQIEDDIKNKISYVSLQNTNVLDQNIDYIMNKKIPPLNKNESLLNLETENPSTEEFLNKQDKNNLYNVFYSFKEKNNNKNMKPEVDEKNLKKQIADLLKKLNR